MKKIIILTFSIFAVYTSCFADNFKDGNKLYLDGKYQDALGQYRQFIQKNSDYYEGYFNAGNAFFRQEQYDAALNMYKKARELNPKDPDIQYNIEVTQKKLSQNSKGKSQKEDQNKQQQKNGQQNQSQNSSASGKPMADKQGKGQNGSQGQQENQKPGTSNKKPPPGMTADEVQALLNQKQNQEKQLKGYFGKQYKKNTQEPDMFNMSPQEMMQYMQQRMMDPFNEQQPPQKNGEGKKKDW
jgi:Ca-activated chloride channel homolog